MQYTTNYSLKKPQYADEADIEIINDNTDDVDSLIHQNRTMIAPAFDNTKAYVTGDPVEYLGALYVFTADKAAGAWDASKVEPTTAAEMGGGGASALADLDDVEITSPTDGQALVYDDTDDTWKNATLPEPVDVEANPSASSTATLSKLKVGSTVYGVSGLPSTSSASNGDVLTLGSGKTPTWASPAVGGDGVTIDTSTVITSGNIAVYGALNYTATQDCFVAFLVNPKSGYTTYIKINNVTIKSFYGNFGNSDGLPYEDCIFLKTGQTLYVNNNANYTGNYHVYGVQEINSAVVAQLNAMKTGFDGVSYPTPAAQVQGSDQRLHDAIDQHGNHNSGQTKYNIWGSESCPVVYGQKLRWLRNYQPYSEADPKYAYGSIDLTKVNTRKLVISIPEVQPSNGQFIVMTDGSSDAVNISYPFSSNPEATAYWEFDIANNKVTVYADRAKAMGWRYLYISSYDISNMYVIVDGNYNWIDSASVFRAIQNKQTFEQFNIYDTPLTTDIIGYCSGYDTSTYLPTYRVPELRSYHAYSKFVMTKITLMDNIGTIKFPLPTKTIDTVTLVQAIILSGTSSAFNIVYSSIESAYDNRGVVSDGETITINVKEAKKNGYNDVYIAHVYDPTFAVYISDVVFDWVKTKENIQHLAIPKFYNLENGNSRMFIGNIFSGDLEEYSFEKAGSGNLKSRYVDYSTIPASDYFTRIEAYKSGKLVDSVQIPYKSVAANAKSGQTVKVIMIGDSTIAAGIITAQLVNAASKNNLTIQTLGTLPRTVQNSDGETVTVNTEGRNGWSTYDYLHTESFNNHTNAFLKNGVFDFSAYITDNSIAAPDWVTIQLGINDGWRPMNGTTTWENIKDMIDSIREYSNTVKIGIALCLPPYMGENRSANAKNTSLRRFNISKDIIENLSNLSGVYIIPISAAFDAEYAFNTTTEQIGDWITKEITVPTDETHPSKYGYYQIADMYNAAIMCN